MKLKPNKRVTKLELAHELQALQLIEKEYRLLLDESSDPIFAFYPDGRYRYVNQAFANGVGFERINIVGKKIWDVFSRDEADKRFAVVKWVFENGKTRIIEVRVPRPDGDRFYVTTVKPILSDDGTAASVICISKDITERKRAEEERLQLEQQFLQAQKLESLGIMAGGIAHDFNNLLQSILGNMELALQTLPRNSGPHKYITSAFNSGQTAAHLTSLMLAYVGKGSLEIKNLDLNELVRVNADMLKTPVGSAISFELSLSQESPKILADESQIQQVIMNLLTNAAESIEEQPSFVRLTTGIQYCDQACLATSLLDKKPEPGRYVFMEISDTGCGMSAETMKRLFDPFFTTKFTGRGLGMSAVMGIMKSHNGALFVQSELGRGTTFRALFPVSEATLSNMFQQESTSPAEISTMAEKPLSGVALVVDDEKNVLRTCKKMTELCGFTVITASDGVDAVSQFREHSEEIDVVLLDLTMPNMDGITAMNEIYRIRPNVKLIISSGFNEDELSGRINGNVPTGFIRKPYSLTVLETELRRVMLSE